MIRFDRHRDANEFDAYAESLGVDVGPHRDASLRFAELVSQWGQKTDLVKAESVAALLEVLFLDAWTLAPLLTGARTLIDIGAGAGAPTIPLALALPALERATLVEPRRRRVAFMRTAIGTLDLAGRVVVVEGRSDELDLEPVDVGLSRATFEPAEWLRVGSTLATRVVVLLARAEPPSHPGWAPVADVAYQTHEGAPRRALVFAKSAA